MHWHQLPHHDGSELYSPGATTADARRLGAPRTVRVRVPSGFGELAGVWVRALLDAEARFLELRPVPTPIPGDGAAWWEGAFLLENPVVPYRFLLNRADGTALWLNGEGVDTVEPVDALDFRATLHQGAPAWASALTMYQLFPDRFARSEGASARPAPDWAIVADWADEVVHEGPGAARQLFGGDLDGAVEHLDHLSALGVGMVYLTPFFPGGSNHRYDATSFDRVDPLLGGDEALIRFVTAAHARGIRVIGDLTTNHTGHTHEWFRSAHGDPAAPESDFYYWKDDAHTDYVSWYGVESLPKLNWDCAELRRRFIDGPDSVVARWLLPPFELDGWRVDVANMTGRHGADDFNAFVQRAVRRTMDEVAPGSLLFAESTNDTGRDFDGSGWQGAMSYSAFTRPLWHWLRRPEDSPRHHFGIPYATTPRATAQDFVRAYRRFTAASPWSVRLASMNAIDTHDIPRFAERADDALQLVAAGLSASLPGTPVIFAGDEFGLGGRNGEDSRKPLPWSVPARLAEPYAQLTALRRSSPALQSGGLRWLHAGAESLAFLREGEQSTELVVAFRGAGSFVVPDGAGAPGASPTLAFGDVDVQGGGGSPRTVTASGPAFAVWTVRQAGHALQAPAVPAHADA